MSADGGVTRRALLAGAAGLGLGVGVDKALRGQSHTTRTAKTHPSQSIVPFHGRHQAGIGTPAQNFLYFAAFDVATDARSDLVQLLRRWTVSAVSLTKGDGLSGRQLPDQPPIDPGEATELGAANLTLTFGFGPGIFERDGDDRFGLRGSRPPALRDLPSFEGEALNAASSGGDLCVQACADDPQVAFHAVHALAREATGAATIRWTQLGFGRTSSTGSRQSTPRNLIGFKDGTANIRADDLGAMDRFVWVQSGDGPAWLTGGSFLMVRRIRILFDVWDAATLEEQERAVGRHKASGAPLGGRSEYDQLNLSAVSNGERVVPADAHVRLAHPVNNRGQRILRRGYSYSEAVEPGSGQIDAGLFFVSFQRDPRSQVVPLLRRLAKLDALARHTLHTSSALFACPPGASAGELIGERLFSR